MPIKPSNEPISKELEEKVLKQWEKTMANWKTEGQRNFEEENEIDKTVVVNVKREVCDIYIGRWNPKFPNRDHKWGNPIKLEDVASRREALVKYEQYIRSKPELMAALPELKGKRLGCWCAPLPCHGDVLVKLLKEIE